MHKPGNKFGGGTILLALAITSFALSQFAMAADTCTNCNQVVATAAAKSVVTIYGNRYAQVEETRTLDLKSGANSVRLDGIAQQYRQESFKLVSVSDPAKFQLRSVVYQPATLNKQQLLEGSIGQQITVHRVFSQADMTGNLKAINGDELVIEAADGSVHSVSASGGVSFGKANANLSNSASLVLEVNAASAGKYELKFLYETEGVTYNVKHSITLREVETIAASPLEGPAHFINFETNVTLYNQSGTSFNNATVHLLSGNIVAQSRGPGGMYRPQQARSFDAEADLDEEAAVESVGEQKQYTLPGSVSLVNGQSRQVSLIAANDVSVKQQYFASLNYYESSKLPTPASVRLQIHNDAEHKLGREIPGGPVKIYQLNSHNNLQLTGTAALNAKSPGECFDLTIGNTPDIKFEEQLVEQTDITPASPTPNQPRVIQRVHKVTVHNYKKKGSSEVNLELSLPPNSVIKGATNGFAKTSATEAKGKLTVGSSGGVATLDYTSEVTQ